MPYPDSFLQELSDRNDIIDVISQYVRLTKRSGSNSFGLCPFHSEKTPSFSVNPDKQMFYCFGCGKGGGTVNFIMLIENISYSDAIHFLAKRAGIKVPEDKPDPDRHRRERMLELNRKAARFFYDSLLGETGSPAREYVLRRGIPKNSVRTFGLGYAPDSYDALFNAMKAAGFTEADLLDAGLLRRGRQGGVYDTFRNRLMFPVIDVRGDVIGFSGRIIGDGEPKYLNSPETLVFNKSRNLFALNLAKKSKRGFIILSEGNIDVVALHSAGFDSAVASLGTSLTQEQARLLSRYTSKVVIAFDSDEAGKKATERAITLLERLDLSVRVLNMKDAKDPDEYIKKYGATAFQKLLDVSENHIEYRLDAIASKYDLHSDEDRVQFLRESAELLASLYGDVEREVYSIRVSEMAGISRDALVSEIQRVARQRENKVRKNEERYATAPQRSLQPIDKKLAYENLRSAQAEEGIIRLLCLDPLLAASEELPDENEFSSEFLGKLYSELRRRLQIGEQITLDSLSGIFASEELSHLARIIQKPENLSEVDRILGDYIGIIREERAGMQVNESVLFKMAEDYRLTKGEYRTKGYGDEAR